MSFTIEREKQNRLSFLDIEIIREDITFTTSVYRKPTFSGVYTHFDSFLPSTYKFGTVYILVGTVYTHACRCVQIFFSWTKSHNELACLNSFFLFCHLQVYEHHCSH